jgi:SHS2 domain-containing protein
VADHDLRACGATLEEVFAQIVGGLAGLVQPGSDATPDRMPVLVRAAEPPQLLARFIADLLELIHEAGFVALRLERFTLEDGELRAAVSGWSGTVPTSPQALLGSDLRYDVADRRWRARARLG